MCDNSTCRFFSHGDKIPILFMTMPISSFLPRRHLSGSTSQCWIEILGHRLYSYGNVDVDASMYITRCTLIIYLRTRSHLSAPCAYSPLRCKCGALVLHEYRTGTSVEVRRAHCTANRPIAKWTAKRTV